MATANRSDSTALRSPSPGPTHPPIRTQDRHNGNILLTRDGSVVHIDFGILLNVNYSKDLLMEPSMKLSSEFVEVCPPPS